MEQIEWKHYDGYGMPVSGDKEVICKLRCGLITVKVKANRLDWEHHYRNFYENPSDIVEYALR